MKHDDDLCPRTQITCERALEAFVKHREIVYDIQGPRDSGVDVVLRTVVDDRVSLACFQIKSDRELGSKGLLQTLKAQWFDASSHYDAMTEYFILLCGDAVRRRRIVRMVSAEFAATPNVTVIEPQYAWTFLHLQNITVDAVVRGRLMEGDAVVKDALQLVEGLTPTEIALLALVVTTAIEGEVVSMAGLVESALLRSVYEVIPDTDRWTFDYPEDVEEADPQAYTRNRDFETRLVADLDSLQDGWIDQGTDSLFEAEAADSHLSLIYDARVRYEYSGDRLASYLYALLPSQTALPEHAEGALD